MFPMTEICANCKTMIMRMSRYGCRACYEITGRSLETFCSPLCVEIHKELKGHMSRQERDNLYAAMALINRAKLTLIRGLLALRAPFTPEDRHLVALGDRVSLRLRQRLDEGD